MEGRARLLTPVLQAGRTHLIKPHLAGPLWGPGHMSRGPHGGPIHCRGKPAVTSPHRLESVAPWSPRPSSFPPLGRTPSRSQTPPASAVQRGRLKLSGESDLPRVRE